LSGSSVRGRSRRTIDLIAAARGILEEIQPASVRAVCYRLFVGGLLPDMSRASTNSVSRILTRARELGEIPWSWIVDESRDVEAAPSWESPQEIVQAAVRGYRRDNWQDQPYRVEVWSEKGTIRGTLRPVLDEFGVAFRVMHGYASATVLNTIAYESRSSDKPLTALYVGDWDPSGKHMSDVDLPARLERYGGTLTVRRIALIAEDLASLPSFDPDSKQQDPRHRWFMQNVGTQCYELDALPPPVLRERVRAAIVSMIDMDAWNHAALVERAQIESMGALPKLWLASNCGGAS
jgi:hypothetical protein